MTTYLFVGGPANGKQIEVDVDLETYVCPYEVEPSVVARRPDDYQIQGEYRTTHYIKTFFVHENGRQEAFFKHKGMTDEEVYDFFSNNFPSSDGNRYASLRS